MDPTRFTSLPLLIAPPLIAGLAVALALRARARATLGPTLAADRPHALVRRATLLSLDLAAFALVLTLRDLPLPPIALVLALAAAISLLLPGFGDAVLGEHGVQRGFHARRFEELEEWRLTGDHLRFRLHGEWTAVPAPSALHPMLREKLSSTSPTRESRFQD